MGGAAVFYLLSWLAHFGLRFLRERQLGQLVAVVVGAIAALGSVLYLSEATAPLWGWSYYLFIGVITALGVAKSTFWRDHERQLFHVTSLILMILVTLGLFELGYDSDLLAMPFIFLVVPLLYLGVRVYYSTHLGWRVAIYLWALALGAIALAKLDDAGQMILETWHWTAWAQVYALGYLTWSCVRPVRDDQPLTTRLQVTTLESMSLATSVLAVAVFAMQVGGEVWPSPGQIWQLALLAGEILLLYRFFARQTRERDFYLNLSGLWVIWWWLAAIDLSLDTPQWYVQPLFYYLAARVCWHRAHERILASDRQALSLAMIASAFCWRFLNFGNYTGWEHLMALLTGIATFALGYRWREETWRRVGAGIVIVWVLTYAWFVLWGLGPVFWVGALGVGLLVAATVILRRHTR